ncbi:pentapeptide repeat-containing protein [Synergistaceae bacterium OttesenSCG-928-I11]|nr:pentapeptide repeat-containing protein [Synergistaceae bacterium OttesenSCG-928-I11]
MRVLGADDARRELAERGVVADACLRGISFADLRLFDVELSGCRLEDCDFDGFDGGRVSFGRCACVGLSMRHAHLDDAVFLCSTMPACRFDRSALGGARFEECDLSNTSFSGAGLAGASFSDCKLLGSDFAKANAARMSLRRCNMQMSNLKFQNFRKARFEEVDFSEADLVGADFTGAVFDRCRFATANLSGALFANADLSTSDLAGFNLHACKSIRNAAVSMCGAAQLLDSFGVRIV